MKTIFTDSENCKASDAHRLRLNLMDRTDWRKGDNHVVLLNLSNYYTLNKINKSYKNNKFEVSGKTWDEEFELPHGSYSMSNIEDNIHYIIKKHEQ